MAESDPLLTALYRRVLAGQHGLTQVAFDAAVLDRYRGQSGYSLVRTDTVGRLKREGGWSLDLGIDPRAERLHACLEDLAALPDEERQHWAAHVALPEASRHFLQMRLHPGACIDDGEVRRWE